MRVSQASIELFLSFFAAELSYNTLQPCLEVCSLTLKKGARHTIVAIWSLLDTKLIAKKSGNSSTRSCKAVN